jgi:hypothetical protein
MANQKDQAPRFVDPGRYLLNMLLFLIAVGAVVYYLSPFSPEPSTILVDAFDANPALNGLILAVLLFGIIYNFRRAEVIYPSVRWVHAYYDHANLPRREPLLIRAMAKVLRNARGGGRLTAEATRAILDSIGTRMDETREEGRYIGHLLVFLGLLGTFWGLIQTVNGVVSTISGLAVAGADTEAAIAQLINNLKAPLSGMGTAFSSSLFGLSGSLVVGFLDLQSSQAQGRFYTDLEDWLSSMTDARAGAGGDRAAMADAEQTYSSLEAALAANTEALIKAQAGQMAELKEEIRALTRSIIRSGKE